jgi:hypothetical protein
MFLDFLESYNFSNFILHTRPRVMKISLGSFRKSTDCLHLNFFYKHQILVRRQEIFCKIEQTQKIPQTYNKIEFFEKKTDANKHY